MSDNEESRSSLSDGFAQDDLINEENNELAKNLEDLSKEDPPSTINKITQTYTVNTINNLKNDIKENIFPYLNNDKIPEIKIKDENHFVSGENIKDYLTTSINNSFNDNIYNICERCKKNINCIFCKTCYINICDICFKDCKNYLHEFIELQKLSDEFEFYKNNIKRIIIKENFIEPEKK